MNNKVLAVSSEKFPSNMSKMRRFWSSCACAKYHPGLYSLLIHTVVSTDSADSEGPDQTARMRRLIWAFAVRICPKTRFRMARPV